MPLDEDFTAFGDDFVVLGGDLMARHARDLDKISTACRSLHRSEIFAVFCARYFGLRRVPK